MADQTLLGVAPPRIDSSAEMAMRPAAPVLVRAGTLTESEPAPPSQLAPSIAAARAAAEAELSAQRSQGVSERLLGVARRRPVLWMVVTPLLVAAFALSVGRSGQARRSAAPLLSAAAPAPPALTATTAPARPEAATIAALEAKAPESLTAQELVLVADARAERQRTAVRALRNKVEADPALAKDSALQSELLRAAGDERTARDALAAMAVLDAPVGADLLYEAWTSTPVRTETTDLARALVYSSDVRPKASPALAVALALRSAESCEQYKSVLPQALQSGDRRSLHLLSKLTAKRGCGPKKAGDCFGCLRESSDELTATISAVKGRRAPSYSAR